jgi:Calponin homology (CH) domain
MPLALNCVALVAVFIAPTSAHQRNCLWAAAVAHMQSFLDVTGTGGSTHSYSIEETMAFSRHINQALASVKELSHRLPLAPEDLFTACADGIIFCQLVNDAAPGSISASKINRGEPMSIFQSTENCNFAIHAAVKMGCNIINIGAQDIIQEKVCVYIQPHIVRVCI